MLHSAVKPLCWLLRPSCCENHWNSDDMAIFQLEPWCFWRFLAHISGPGGPIRDPRPVLEYLGFRLSKGVFGFLVGQLVEPWDALEVGWPSIQIYLFLAPNLYETGEKLVKFSVLWLWRPCSMWLHVTPCDSTWLHVTPCDSNRPLKDMSAHLTSIGSIHSRSSTV